MLIYRVELLLLLLLLLLVVVVVVVAAASAICIRSLVGSLRERKHLKDLGIDGRLILKLVCKKWDRGAWTGLL
jgi:hypothetical protein